MEKKNLFENTIYSDIQKLIHGEQKCFGKAAVDNRKKETNLFSGMNVALMERTADLPLESLKPFSGVLKK